MALVFCDGFHIAFDSTSPMPAGIWTSATRLSGTTYLGTDPDVKRTGRAGLRATRSGAAGSSYLSLSLPQPLTELFIGVAFRISSASADAYYNTTVPILALYNNSGTTLLTIGFNLTSSAINVYRGRINDGTLIGTGTATLNRDTWYYLEFKIALNSTSGVLESKVNGNEDITFAGNTSAGTQAFSCNLGLTPQSFDRSASGTYYFDDFVLLDTSGSLANTWPGQPTVHWIAPDGPGEYDQWEKTGADTAWEAIDDWVADGEVDDATTRISSADEGEKTSVALSNLPVSGTPLGLQVVTRAANELPGADIVQAFLRFNDEDYAIDDWIAGTSYNVRLTLVHASPATAEPWTKAEIDALELGYEVVIEE